MIKKVLLKKYQKRIEKLDPPLSIRFHKDIPLPSAKEILSLSKLVSEVNSHEQALKDKPDIFFKEKTQEFKQLIEEKTRELDGEDYKYTLEITLDEILPFYYAMVREAAHRTVNMRHFDVQILGGIILHKNKIAEMATGEGKTLVATLAASLNALTQKGVHVVTVNDYLARRDREWMGAIYEFLGFSCGVIQQDMSKAERKIAYACDITYGTNNEFGFDYLRDNMVNRREDMVQNEHFYAIVDEVDSILIDEARTPLIISGPSEISTDKYYVADKAVRQLNIKTVISRHDTKEGMVVIKNSDGTETQLLPEEFEDKYEAIVEEKTHNAYLTKRGEHKCESILGVKSISEDTPDKFSNSWSHYVSQSLRGHRLFKKDRDYIVKDGKVIIVDEFTGRLMPGRRWSDGLHQAIEAKESLKIQEESQTLATITLQNYFRMYDKLAGMTGTAYTEANELKHIYKVDVVVVPTNRDLQRLHYPDRIYKSKRAKFNAVVSEISELYKITRPVLVGTTSIEDSEEISFMLKKKGIPHNVLNAKYHEREAYIVAQAGRLSQITIATNMAGRGTDIILGGNIDYFIKDVLNKNEISPDDPRYRESYRQVYTKYQDAFLDEHKKVVELGGLHVIGTQRHEARRIDNQLQGRTGRQGDPGSSRSYVSLEDDLMRLFGSERIHFLMEKFGFPEDEPIEHPLVSRSIEIAQKKVEAHNFEIRKQLLQYDNIMNSQREIIYQQRQEVLTKEDMRAEIIQMIDDIVEKTVPAYYQQGDFDGLLGWLKAQCNISLYSEEISTRNEKELLNYLKQALQAAYENRVKDVDPLTIRHMEKVIALWIIDSRWKEHLLIMDSLREGVSLRAYAHVDPLIEYQKESYGFFNQMIDSIKEGIVESLFKTRVSSGKDTRTVFAQLPKSFIHSEYSSLEEKEPVPAKTLQQTPVKKVGRNDPCPCGSGKKYKKCCGK